MIFSRKTAASETGCGCTCYYNLPSAPPKAMDSEVPRRVQKTLFPSLSKSGQDNFPFLVYTTFGRRSDEIGFNSNNAQSHVQFSQPRVSLLSRRMRGDAGATGSAELKSPFRRVREGIRPAGYNGMYQLHTPGSGHAHGYFPVPRAGLLPCGGPIPLDPGGRELSGGWLWIPGGKPGLQRGPGL